MLPDTLRREVYPGVYAGDTLVGIHPGEYARVCFPGYTVLPSFRATWLRSDSSDEKRGAWALVPD